MNFPLTIEQARPILENKMIEVLSILEKRYKKPMPILTIQFDRLGLRGGYARRFTTLIVLNSDYLLRESLWNEMLNIILPHEVCHHVAPVIYNRWLHGTDKGMGWSHGRAWKECMVSIGLPPNRCGIADEERINILQLRKVERKYAYKCGCKEIHFLTKIKHNRVQNGRYRNLHCTRCKVTLVYVGEKMDSLKIAA